MEIKEIVIYSVKYAIEHCIDDERENDESSDRRVIEWIHKIVKEGNHNQKTRNKMIKRIARLLKAREAQKRNLFPYSLLRGHAFEFQITKDQVSESQDVKEHVSEYQDAKGQIFECLPQKDLGESGLDELYHFVQTHGGDKSFGSVVYEIMELHNMTPPQVYRNARLSRQDFSRITSERSSGVKKSMAWNIIIGLHCSLEEADRVLYSAGYIRRKNYTDLIMEYFIGHKNYDIMAINDALLLLGQRPLVCYLPVKNKDPFY